MTGTFCPLDLRSEARGGVPREATPSTPTIASPPERASTGSSLQSGVRVLYRVEDDGMGCWCDLVFGSLSNRIYRLGELI
jgi:hypothetical protein